MNCLNNKSFLLGLFLLAGLCGIALAEKKPDQGNEQPPAYGGGKEKESVYTITERGAHHKVWERIEYEPGPDGKQFPRKHSYTELATGMHFKNARGEWEESKEEIELLPNNAGAVANKGPHKAIFPSEIKSGLIELQTPDQKWMRSRVWGLAYFDSATGESVLLAEVKESEGQLVGDNVVLYPNAFTDFVADIRYTYTRAGFEQDVVLREQPPAPETFNLNPKTTRLQVLTEFVEAPSPAKNRRSAEAKTDETLGFGEMEIGAGKAFSVDAAGGADGHTPVDKTWTPIEGRDFLIEEVHYEDVTDQLQKLPQAKKYDGTSLMRRGRGKNVLTGLKNMLPKRYSQTAPVPNSKPRRMAKAEPKAGLSFVMDYASLSSSSTNYAFKGDTTYYISGTFYSYGTNTFEGGAVIKYAANAALLVQPGPVGTPRINWLADAYRPVVFTAKDDNSVGETISGSTGNPSGGYANPALAIIAPAANPTIENFRISYAKQAISLTATTVKFYHGQIVSSQNGVTSGGGGNGYLRNMLFAGVQTNLNQIYAGTFYVENTTFSSSSNLTTVKDQASHSAYVYLTNCILANITALTNNYVNGPLGYQLQGNQNAFYNSPSFGGDIVSVTSFPFQTIGGGAYYLTTNSLCRNAGTTNVDVNLLASLKTKTTYPPVAYTNVTFTAPITFNPQAQRDTDMPDLGYHYDPLDYSLGGCAASTNLTFAAGTAVGWFRTSSGWQYAGQAIRMIGNIVVSFEGTATAPTYFVRLNTAQENDRTAGYGHGGIENWEGPAVPIVRGRFLRCSAMANETFNGYFADDYGGIRAEMTHTEFWGGALQTYGDYMFYTNCLMWRLGFVGVVNGGASSAFAMRNCTMVGGKLSMMRAAPIPVLVRDCSFDGTTIELADSYGSNPTYTDCDYNAYTNTSNPFPVGGTHNVPVSSSFNWQTGPLGDFYLPTNSTLINTGSVTAPNIALYHFTTQSDQAKEASSQVDIGYHYVAMDSFGNQIDSDGDGVPDYVEDGNGNGVYDAGTGETPWTCLGTPSGLVSWWEAGNNALDSWGTNHCSLLNGATYTATGKRGQGFSLDGINDRIVCDNTSGLNFGVGADFSMECWIRAYSNNTAYGVMTILSKRYAPYGSITLGYELCMVYGLLGVRMDDPVNKNAFSSTGPDLRDGQFHHVAVTVDRDSVTGGKIYVDGNVVFTFNPSISPGDLSNTEPFRIGNHPTSSLNCYFKGTIDEPAVYNRALSAPEIQGIYQAGAAGKCPLAPSIVTQPQTQAVTEGSPVTFTVIARGSPTLNYQWYKGATPVGVNSSSLVIGSAQLTDVGSYHVEVSSPSLGSVSSATVLLTVNPAVCVAPVSELVSWWPGNGGTWDAIGGNNAQAQGGLNYSSGRVGQGFNFNGTDAALRIPGAVGLDVGLGNGFTIEGWINPADLQIRSIAEWNPNDDVTLGVHLYLSVVASGELFANLVDTANNSHTIQSSGGLIVAGIYQHVALTYDKNSGVARLIRNGVTVKEASLGNFTPNTSADLYLGLRTKWGGQYRFKGSIDEFSVYNRALTVNEVKGIYDASIAGKCEPSPAAPVITFQPASQTVVSGQNTAIRAAARGTPLMTYQWFYEGVPISGATAPSLDLNDVQPGQSGNYSVLIANYEGTATSSSAYLTVKPAPITTVWVDDPPLPADSNEQSNNEAWDWYDYWYDMDESGGWYWSEIYPQSGSYMHVSGLVEGDFHQHYFDGATERLHINPGDTLFAYINIDPAYPPSEIVLQWHDVQSGWWEHRAYWGENELEWGEGGTESRYYMGALPEAWGEWVRLEVPAAVVGLEGLDVDGIAFSLNNGRAAWDSAGKTSSDDYDNDNMSDEWERQYFGGLTHTGAVDSDNDGMTDLEEYRRGTNPTNPDSDGDGLSDFFEVAYGFNPNASAVSDTNNVLKLQIYTPLK